MTDHRTAEATYLKSLCRDELERLVAAFSEESHRTEGNIRFHCSEYSGPAFIYVDTGGNVLEGE